MCCGGASWEAPDNFDPAEKKSTKITALQGLH